MQAAVIRSSVAARASLIIKCKAYKYIVSRSAIAAQVEAQAAQQPLYQARTQYKVSSITHKLQSLPHYQARTLPLRTS